MVATVDVGDGPEDLEYNPSNEAIYVVNEGSYSSDSGTVSVISEIKPIANAGPDQTVDCIDVLQLDAGNSSDPKGSSLAYFWNQTSGPKVTLSDPTASNPTFTVPEVNDQTELTFQLTVTTEEGIVSEPNEVIITINPIF